jgi:hypothetical protein
MFLMPGGLAPGQDLLGVLGAGAVAQARVGHARLAGPAAVAVHDQPDVLWELPREDLAAQPTGVERVDAGHSQQVRHGDALSQCPAS